MFKRFLQMAAVALALWTIPAQAEDYLLYWQVSEDASIIGVDGTEVGTVSDYTDSFGKSITVARAVSSSAQDGLLIYDIYAEETIGSPIVGAATGTGELFSLIGSYDSSAGLAGLSFAIELGNWENGQWTTLATTGMVSYENLTQIGQTEGGAYILTPNQALAVPEFSQWSPKSYNVPEPSSGLLALIGAALLALRRRRC